MSAGDRTVKAGIRRELSEGLKDLRGMLTEYIHEPRTLDPNDAAMFVSAITMMLELVCDLAQEPTLTEALSMRLEKTDRVLTEITRPGTNVKLFPVVPRPFHDGRPRGGAA